MNRSSILLTIFGWLLALAVMVQPVPAAGEEAWSAAGLRAEAAGEWGEALRIYREVLAREPEQPELWLRVADVEARLDHPDAVAEATAQAALRAPEDAAIQFRLAQACSVADRPEQALAAAEKAVAIEPGNVKYLHGRARLANWIGRYDLAQDSYERILAIDADDRSASLGLARVEAWSGRLDEAAHLYRTYTDRYPEDASGRLEYARTEAWRGNYPVSMSVLDAYRRERGETEAYLDDKARVFLGAGRPNAALRILDPRLASEPESFDLKADHTLALAASGRPRQALSSLEHLVVLGAGRARTDEVQRIVGTPLRTAVTPQIDVYSDSDGVSLKRFELGSGVSLAPRSRFIAGIYSGVIAADAGSGLEPANGDTRLDFSGLWLGLEQRLGPKALLGGRLGEAEVVGGANLLTYRLGVSLELSDALELALERRRSFYLVSPRALDLGIDDTRHDLALRWRPNLRYHVDASAAHDSLSDGNDRWELVLAPRRVFLRREHFNLDLGLRAWWFGFDEDFANGYYDPGRYQSYSFTGFGYWKINANSGMSFVVSLGAFEDDSMQDFELGGGANVELVVGVYRDWKLQVRAGFTENSRLQSGAFNAYSGGILLTRRFSGPGGRPSRSFRPVERPVGVAVPEAAIVAADSTVSEAAVVMDQVGEHPPPVPASPVPENPVPVLSEAVSPEPVSPEPGPPEPVSLEPASRQPVAAPATPPERRRIFELQLALFHQESNARAFLDAVNVQGQHPYVVEVESSQGETRYTVRIGPYPSMAAAVEMAARILAEEGLQPVVRYRSVTQNP